MIEFTTVSGAVYTYDEPNLRLRRNGTVPVQNVQHVDSTWHAIEYPLNLVLGRPVAITWYGGGYRLTTPLFDMKEVSDD